MKLKSHKEYVETYIIAATFRTKNLRLAVTTVYTPTGVTKSESTKIFFSSALNKANEKTAKNERFKCITLEEFNTSISARNKDCSTWDSLQGHNNPDKIKIYGRSEEMLIAYKSKIKILKSFFGLSKHIVKLGSMLLLINRRE